MASNCAEIAAASAMRDTTNSFATKGKGALSLRAVLIASTILAGTIEAGQAQAQEAPSAVDVIVVTAQRRAEDLQDVPVSVSALSGEQLDNMRLQSVDDIVALAPSLQVQSPGGEGTPIFALRGISMSDFSANQSGPVATYFDEIYKGASSLLGVSMYDLERIEVLRGPQGTLYGKNTTGGAINIISKLPEFENSADLSVGYGNYNHWQTSGNVNAALSDQIATRFAFTAEKADGWGTNSFPGKPKPYATDEYAGRLSVVAKPTDGAEFVLRIAGSSQTPENYSVTGAPLDADGIGGAIYNQFGRPGYFPTGLGEYEVENNKSGRRILKTWSASLTGNIDLPNDLTLTSITSWDWGKLFIPEDSDGSPLPALEIDYEARGQQVAQDLRLTSNYDGPFNFIVGAYYNRESIFNATTMSFFTDIDVDGSGTVDTDDCLANFFLACKFGNSFKQVKTSTAVYTDLNYAVTDQLTLRGGLRYTHDEGELVGYQSQIQDVDGNFLANLILPSDIAAQNADQFTKNNVSGKIGFDYNTNEGQLYYLTVSRGYRGNAFNAQAFFAPSEVNVVEPETLTDVEAGAKLEFFDRRVILNFSAFHYDYENMQFLNLDNGLQILVNVPKARVFGGEVELTAKPVEELTLRMGLGLLKSEIREGNLKGIDLRGNQLPTAPSSSLNLGADWTVAELAAGTVSLHADSTITSRQYFDVFNNADQSQKAYSLLNGSLNFESADGSWGASLWAKNILDQFYYSYRVAIDTTAGNYQHPGAPRTFGATLDFHF